MEEVSNRRHITQDMASESIKFKKSFSSTAVKVGLVGLATLALLAVGGTVGFIIGGATFTAIAVGAILGALTIAILLLILKVSQIFINHFGINQHPETNFEQLRDAIKVLSHQFFDKEKDWFKQLKMNDFHAYSQNVDAVKKELLARDLSTLVFAYERTGFLSNSAKHEFKLKSLEGIQEEQHPNILFRVIRELYKQINLLGEHQILQIKEIGKELNASKKLNLDPRLLDVKSRVAGILESDKRDDFENLIKLLSTISNKQPSQFSGSKKSNALASKIVEYLFNDPDANLKLVFSHLIENYHFEK